MVRSGSTRIPANQPQKLRSKIVPGAVLILLRGAFAGKRVVCLKAFDNGEVAVTGPFSLNGVPLLRVNHRYVIATSTKVPLDGVDTAKVTGEVFKKAKRTLTERRAEREERFLAQSQPRVKTGPSEERKALQAAVDTPLVSFLSGDEDLKAYMKTPFTLTNSVAPHMLKF